MSDFLSKFNKDKYQDLVDEQVSEAPKEGQVSSKQPEKPRKQKDAQTSTSAPKNEKTTPKQSGKLEPKPVVSRRNYQAGVEEDVEIDLDYKRKRKIRMLLIASGSVLALLLIFFIYYQLVHVKVEDFGDQPVSEVRAWAKENGVEIELKQEHSMVHDVNNIISQGVPAGKKVKKGKTLHLTSSLGPDPEDVIPLAEFSEMSQEEAMDWITENKAENLQMVTEYSDDIEAGVFIKLTIKDNAIDASTYKRKDGAVVYYSKGQEVFEKNITIPSFIGAPKEEVEKWATTHEIEMTYKESDSNSVEAGNVISQSEDADEKIAKRDKMEVVVSVGKAIVVPSFAGLTAEEAVSNYPDLEVTIKQVFHSKVSYGKLISQSVEAETKLTEKDDKQVTVTYSQGKPYLSDYRGQLEGDLPRLFYEEYQSKGANIKYTVKYVDSHEVKGTVVKMSKFNEFVAMNYTVEISISNNALAPPNPPDFPGDELLPPGEEEVE